MENYPEIHFRQLYDQFDEPVIEGDCGLFCSKGNPSGKPVCCDLCHAVPAVYQLEWNYLRQVTSLWHPWLGTECSESPEWIAELRASTPETMQLMACLGPAQCQRSFRALSCRQFPFYPYITEDFRFIGLAYEWEFESTCWVIQHLDQVRLAYRQSFVAAFDQLFNLWPDEMESYADLSSEMREVFAARRRRIPILHRNGKAYRLSPGTERLEKVILSSTAN